MSENSGLLGCGTVFLAPYENGKPSNSWYDLDEADKYEIKENVSEKTRKSKRCESYGQLKSQVPIKEPAELSLTFSTMNKENFATLFMSKPVDTVQAAGTFTEAVLTAMKGRSVHLKTRNLDAAALVVKNADDTITYVADTDYVIENAKMGFVKILESGSIANGALNFSGSMAESKSVRMVGGSQYDRRFSVKLVGKNLDTGQPHIAYVYDVRLAPQSGVDFLADDFVVGELTGKPVLDPVTGESYIVETDIT